MMGIYLIVGAPDLSEAEVEKTPGLGVSMTTTGNGFTESRLEESYYNIACDKLDSSTDRAHGDFDLNATLRELADGIYKMGPFAIADNPLYPEHPVPPVPVASVLTAIVLAQQPLEEKELYLHGLATFSHELNFGQLLGLRLLASLRLIETLNPPMFQFITASLELTESDRYPGSEELLKMQEAYVSNITDIVAFLIMQKHGLMDSEDTAMFKQAPLLRVLTPELAQFDKSEVQLGDFTEMCSNFYSVIDFDGYREMFFGSKPTFGGRSANSNLKYLMQHIKVGVLNKILAFDSIKRRKSATYLVKRNQLLTGRFQSMLRAKS